MANKNITGPATGKKTGSAKARKSSARLGAVQVLYQMRLNNQDAKSAIAEFISHRVDLPVDGELIVTADEELLTDIVTGVQKRWSDIDGIVSQTLADGGRDKVEAVLDCILRAGAYELIAHGTIDAGIIINDYLNVTTSFYDGAERKLVNAILDKVAKAVRA
jgi:N utilization substance protein B